MAILAIIGLLIVLLVALIVFFVIYQQKQHSKYFHARNVTFLDIGLSYTIKFFMGKLTLIDIEKIQYEKATETGKKFVGISELTSPSYYITDLELMKHIYVKDSDHFVDRRSITTSTSDILFKKMLISLEGEQWKGMRSKLSPTFTTGKIRKMFDIFDKSSQNMCNYVRKRVGSDGGEFDICEAYSKYAMDVIASCAFGIDSKSFDCEPGVSSEFEEMGKKIQLKVTLSLALKLLVVQVAPKLANMMGLQAIDTGPQDYFKKVITGVMKRRRDTGERHNDFLQLMMDAQQGLLKSEENSKETMEVMTGSKEDNTGNSKQVFSPNDEADGESPTKFTFDDDDIVANAVLFLMAGYDTTQSLLIFAAYMLALDQDAQERLLEEVKSTFDANGGSLTYDGVIGMTYLDCVLNETLRYYPPALRNERLCTKDYKIPGTDTIIEKGLIVGLPIYGMQRDKQYYENPEKFDPERFLPERKAERNPFTFAPFGHGPRNCIGMRFALIEVKAVIATLVYNFKLEPGTNTEIPVKMSNSSTLKPENGMWLKISPRS
ncbi:unnamed protein product [Orchesella dallaii]|uniref:Cytochrome P450 9e2 n=1 Tax=Orchesella dallaii TaxID=48710 RepID=A0ABP1R277_9HEXA